MFKDFYKRVILFILIIGLIFTLGCSSNQDNISVDKDKLVSVLNEEYSAVKNLKLIGDIQKFENDYYTVVSYDISADMHYVDLVTFSVNPKDKSIIYKSKKGGRADNKQPLSYSSAGGTLNNTNSYYITYGEIYYTKISNIALQYNDGQNKTQDVKNNGFLIITKGDHLGVNKLSAFDQNNGVIYSIP